MDVVNLKDVGNNKVKVIQIIREATGWELKYTKEFVDSIATNGSQIFSVLPDKDRDKVINDLETAGATIENSYESSDYYLNPKGNEDFNENIYETHLKEKQFQPLFCSDDISRLDREDTLNLLVEVKKIVLELEECEMQIGVLSNEKASGYAKVNEIRENVSKGAKFITNTVVICAAIVGTLIMPIVMTVICAIIALIIMNLTVKKIDLKRHEEKNNLDADNYFRENVLPIEEELDALYKRRNSLIESGKKGWAMDVVGKEMLYSTCIQDLYDLIKSRRADNLKEALNKYDDTVHRQRMEEMQRAIQNASEISAVESAKQTAYTQEIAKTTHQVATASKATAYHTRQIDRNTRKFR